MPICRIPEIERVSIGKRDVDVERLKPYLWHFENGNYAGYRYKFNPFFEARLGATLSPAKFFSLAATAGYGNYGPCIGAAMSLNFPIVNFFIATDGIFTRVTPQYVPVKPLNTNLNLGLAIAF